MLAAMFRIAIGKRRTTEKSKIKVSGFVCTSVMFASHRQALFHGDGALFVLIEFFALLRRGGIGTSSSQVGGEGIR